MPAPVSGNNWERIRKGLKDAQLLNSQRKYNLSMIKCRQTLEFMVQDLCDKAAITTTNSNQDLSSLIDELYSNRWISKTTCEHYHKIRMLGNKAAHEGNENAYDANQACQLLSHEAVTFSKDYMNASPQRPQQRSSQQRPSGGGQQRPRSNAARSRRRSQEGFPLSSTDLMRIAVVVVAVIIVIALVRLLRSDDSAPEETTPTVSTESVSNDETTAAEEEIPTTAAPETMAETTPAPVYKTTDYLNVRAEPSTSSRRLGVLDTDTVVDYVGNYDETWAIINYEGTQAYVSRQYLTQD